MLLSGQSADGVADNGPVVCACFGVGLKFIRDCIASGTAKDVAGVSKALRAGTNCGSCLPELKRIVAHEQENAGKPQGGQRVAQPV
jgi:assimilatory nitrate reductase catalytic subunit